ncbi:HAD hydrolase-like protein [Pantoea rwandensis]|uniref:HAD hydrolase-like protein n=1 Tax=unclassified Pantoea TaxID=2630326 RepID=UPI001CD75B25|nr:HAD hydrolase-like protein [Pantoea sp. alder69]MCA1252317.1 HAD hydrolase-like protein [Pantoea sp. alder70]MCA1268065.1 HAD hydrolase-like protein [Pantoea sp. alder81]
MSQRHTVFIGDRKEDVIAASINKIASIGVKWGYANLNELEGSGANYICEQPNTLQSMIDYVFKECPED